MRRLNESMEFSNHNSTIVVALLTHLASVEVIVIKKFILSLISNVVRETLVKLTGYKIFATQTGEYLDFVLFMSR